MFESSPKTWPARNGAAEAGKLRALLAEDTPISAEMMQAMADHLGLPMDKASNGLEAIAMIEQAKAEGKPYGLLLLDVMMPILDGIETAKRLRAKGFDEKQLPIIAVTAATDLDEVRSYRAAGMQAFLEKPVGLEDLRSALEAWGHGSDKRKRKVPRDTLRVLQKQFEERNLHALSTIDGAIAEELFDEEIVMEIKNMLHQIAGTAGTFGNPELSEDARRHENALVEVFFDGGDVRGALEAASEDLRKRI